jgi:hypothetical protein
MAFEDKILTCQEEACQREFFWTAQEQASACASRGTAGPPDQMQGL